MKKATKIVSLLLVLVLTIGLFAACGQKEEKEETEAAETTTEATTETTTETTTEATTETTEVTVEEPVDPRDKFEAIDLGGRVIKFASWWPSLAHSGLTEPDPATALPEDIAKYENLKRVEEKYNCTIEYVEVPWGELEPNLTTSVLAGEPYADICFLPMTYLVPAIVNDLATPLSELVKPNSDVITDAVAVNNIGTIVNGEYAVNAAGINVAGVFVGYNRDMIKNLGLRDPQEVYNEDPKAWTWDMFLEYAKAATVDSDGDGNVDTYGLSGFVNNISDQFIIANGSKIYDDYNATQGIDNPKTVEALEFINKMYNVDKVVNRTGDLWDWEYNFNAYKEGKSLFFPGYSWMLSENTLTYDYGCVPFPMGPSNDTGKTWAASYDGFIIPKGTKEAQDIYQVLEELLWFFGDDASVRDDSTLEWTSKLFTTQEDVDMFLELSANGGQLELSGFVPNYPMGTIIGNVVNGEKTVAQAIEENKQVAQDAINAMLGISQ